DPAAALLGVNARRTDDDYAADVGADSVQHRAEPVNIDGPARRAVLRKRRCWPVAHTVKQRIGGPKIAQSGRLRYIGHNRADRLRAQFRRARLTLHHSGHLMTCGQPAPRDAKSEVSATND